jgi:choline dehydrogenase-like flavoprotein
MSGCAAIVFLQLTGEQPTEAEILLIPMGMSFRDKAGEESSEHNINKIKPLPHGMMVYPCMVHPSSRGTLRLASSNPSAPPILSHELMNDHDMTALIAACRKTREIFATSAMKAKAVVEELPGASVQSDEEWSDYLRNATFRVNHPIGTCRMGTDDGAVVDPELRVRGIQGLRVVDASIFPTITSGPTNAPTIMIAERAAELILDSGTPD